MSRHLHFILNATHATTEVEEITKSHHVLIEKMGNKVIRRAICWVMPHSEAGCDIYIGISFVCNKSSTSVQKKFKGWRVDTHSSFKAAIDMMPANAELKFSVDTPVCLVKKSLVSRLREKNDHLCIRIHDMETRLRHVEKLIEARECCTLQLLDEYMKDNCTLGTRFRSRLDALLSKVHCLFPFPLLAKSAPGTHKDALLLYHPDKQNQHSSDPKDQNKDWRTKLHGVLCRHIVEWKH